MFAIKQAKTCLSQTNDDANGLSGGFSEASSQTHQIREDGLPCVFLSQGINHQTTLIKSPISAIPTCGHLLSTTSFKTNWVVEIQHCFCPATQA